MKRTIPKAREEDVLHMYWHLLGALESRCEDKDALDKHLVAAAYNILNDIGYTTHRPQWERGQTVVEPDKGVPPEPRIERIK